MAVRRQSLAAALLPVVRELLFAQSAFQVGTRVYAGRSVGLKVDEVARLTGTEEVVVADFEQIRTRGIGRDVTAELGGDLVCTHDHGERVPALQPEDAVLDIEVARILRLVGERNGVGYGVLKTGGSATR